MIFLSKNYLTMFFLNIDNFIKQLLSASDFNDYHLVEIFTFQAIYLLFNGIMRP